MAVISGWAPFWNSFDSASLPSLPGAVELASAGVETDGAAHNRRFVAAALDIAADVAPELVTLAHDPQTSGGLLAAIPPDLLERVMAAFAQASVGASHIGRVEGGLGVALA